jgi:hypothetical protein
MTAALAAVGVLVALADLALVVACWKSSSVLGGLLASAGIPLIALALIRGVGRGAGRDIIVIAAVMLLLAAALYALGQLPSRLLGDEPPVPPGTDAAGGLAAEVPTRGGGAGGPSQWSSGHARAIR